VEYPFINKEIDNKTLGATIDTLMSLYGIDVIPPVVDAIKSFGFTYATHSGTTWGINDIMIPEAKKAIVSKAKGKADLTTQQFNDGLLTEEERIRKHIEIWQKAKGDVEKAIPPSLDKNGSVYDMVTSGARGSYKQIVQMAGMKGLIASVSGETIEFPILSCSKEGLTPI
jgi:DNA-directed RNA polymerase subunit beta'